MGAWLCSGFSTSRPPASTQAPWTSRSRVLGSGPPATGAWRTPSVPAAPQWVGRKAWAQMPAAPECVGEEGRLAPTPFLAPGEPASASRVVAPSPPFPPRKPSPSSRCAGPRSRGSVTTPFWLVISSPSRLLAALAAHLSLGGPTPLSPYSSWAVRPGHWVPGRNPILGRLLPPSRPSFPAETARVVFYFFLGAVPFLPFLSLSRSPLQCVRLDSDLSMSVCRIFFFLIFSSPYLNQFLSGGLLELNSVVRRGVVKEGGNAH